MFSFRQKIFITYVLAFLIFIAGMYPFAARTVKQIATKAMADRATELIEKIQGAPNNEALIRRLKEQKAQIFFRVSVITDERKVLYDSHTKRLLGPRFSQEYVVDHPEVMQAYDTGSGYHEDYSELLGQKFSYFARAFDFHGKTYIMRTAFPFKYVVEITNDFEIGVIALATAALLLFSIMTWIIINHLTKPIQQIVEAVKPFQEGTANVLPDIKVDTTNPSDDFFKLAQTLNSLNAKIRAQIDTLTQERNEKVAVLESLVEGVVAIESDGTVAYANQMALQFLGFETNQLIGQHFATTQQPKCLALLEECQKENTPLSDTLHIKRNGQKYFLDVVAAPTKQEGGAILVLQDKTSQFKLNEMRKDFIANASHELKTPITIIQGFAETLHDNPGLPAETFESITTKIVRSCIRMTNIIKDLLTLTDVENIPETRLQDCDMREIVDKCADMVRSVYSTAQVNIVQKGSEPIYFTADPSLIELALRNLMENAAKYSNPPAEITVTLEKQNDQVRLKIADKGIGIPAADLEHIFERFYTVNKAHSRKMGGSGLGLSIVETIIAKHFGKIEVESEMGVGTTFTITLPLDRNGHPPQV